MEAKQCVQKQSHASFISLRLEKEWWGTVTLNLFVTDKEELGRHWKGEKSSRRRKLGYSFVPSNGSHASNMLSKCGATPASMANHFHFMAKIV